MQITRRFSVADCAQDLLLETAPPPPVISTSTSFFEFPSKAVARFGKSWWASAGRSSAGDIAIRRAKSNSSPWQARIGNTVDGLLMELLLRRHEVEFFFRSYPTLVKMADTCTVPPVYWVDACLSCNVLRVQQEWAAEVPTFPYTKDKAMMTLPFLHESLTSNYANLFFTPRAQTQSPAHSTIAPWTLLTFPGWLAAHPQDWCEECRPHPHLIYKAAVDPAGIASRDPRWAGPDAWSIVSSAKILCLPLRLSSCSSLSSNLRLYAR